MDFCDFFLLEFPVRFSISDPVYSLIAEWTSVPPPPNVNEPLLCVRCMVAWSMTRTDDAHVAQHPLWLSPLFTDSKKKKKPLTHTAFSLTRHPQTHRRVAQLQMIYRGFSDRGHFSDFWRPLMFHTTVRREEELEWSSLKLRGRTVNSC